MALARAAVAAAGRSQLAARAIATYALKRPLESLVAQVIDEADAGRMPSQRSSTAAVARRQQWAAVPLPADTPRTLAAAMQEPCDQARIVTEAQWPHRVVFANKAWERLCGYSADEVVGRHGLGFLQGELTDEVQVRRINAAVREGERIELRLINYHADGTPFVNHLTITPLSSRCGDYQYSHTLGVVEEVDDIGSCQLRVPAGHAAAGSESDVEHAAAP